MDVTQACFLTLASGSPRRRDLLQHYGYTFEVLPSRVRELPADCENVRHRVTENAALKCREVLDRCGPPRSLEDRMHILVSADTLVLMGRNVYGKPKDMDQAHAFLKELGGRPHVVLTGVYLHACASGVHRRFVEETRVTLRPLNRMQREHLFDRVCPLDKAAGYGYQDAPEIVAEIKGSRTNVFGLPMKRLESELSQLMSMVTTPSN